MLSAQERDFPALVSRDRSSGGENQRIAGGKRHYLLVPAGRFGARRDVSREVAAPRGRGKPMANDDRREVENRRRDDGGLLGCDDHPGGQMPLETDYVAH